MGIDPWGDLQEIQEQQAENEQNQDLIQAPEDEIMQFSANDIAMAASAGSESAADYTWTITSTGSPMYYGASSTISGGTNQCINPGAQWVFSINDSSAGMIIGSPYSASSSYCFFANTKPLTMRIATSVNFNAHDYSTIYVNGYISSHLYLLYKNNSVRYMIEPKTFQLMVNGSPYGDVMDYGTGFDIELDVESLGGITSLGFYFYYPTYTTSFSQGGTTSKVSLGYWLDASTLSFSTQDVSSGLLASILAWLSNILDAIVSLPGRVASAISNVLQSLFVPSQEDFINLKTQYETLLEERLGFIWQAGEWVVTFGQSILTAVQGGNEYTFTFPGISFPMNGTTYVLAEPVQVSLQNAFFDVVRPVLGTIVAIVCVVAFINTARYMIAAVVSGATYFEFLKGRRHDDN